MTIYEFSSNFYYQNRADVLVMVEYLKKVNAITQKDINEEASIPKSNFRRAQQKNFEGYDEIVDKMAHHLHIPITTPKSIIANLDENFSQFYTCICFSKFKEAEVFYLKMQQHMDNYQNSILLVPLHLAQLIYHITEVNYTNQVNHTKIGEAIQFLKHFVDKLSNEHRFLYYEYMAAYAGIMKDQEKVIHYARLTVYLAANYPELEPTANYHVSFAYSLISDFINALIYANKALPKLEEQLNYTKAVFCRMNIATFYKKLGNVDEAKRMLKKNLIYLNFNDIPRLDRVTYLNYADCCLMEQQYTEALKYYTRIIDQIIKRHDYESIMMVYCAYQSNQFDVANAVIHTLKGLHEDEKYNDEYFKLVLFFEAAFTKQPHDVIEKRFIEAESKFQGYKYRGQNIQELAIQLFTQMNNKKTSKTLKSPLTDDVFLA
jgi:tetratricopeptide (TPR) repeat protein